MYVGVAGILVTVGAGVMTLAITRTLRLLERLRALDIAPAWRLLLSAMGAFLLGYFGFLALLAVGVGDGLVVLTGAIFLGGAAFVLGVVQVTDRTIAELQRARLREQQAAELRDRARVERDAAVLASLQKSSFLAHMSHELRTPLNAIIGYSEMLGEELEARADDALAADANRVQAAGRHLLALIDDVLDLSKIEAGELDLAVRRVDVDALLADVLATARPLASRQRNTLVLECEEPLGAVDTDPMRLRQCLLNLLSNAAKFTENGRIVLRARRTSDRVLFDVVDTGIGIEPAHLERIFEAFQQADDSSTRRFGGTGLGLTLTRQLAERMGGNVSVTSRPGDGSTFSLHVPVRGAPLAASPP